MDEIFHRLALLGIYGCSGCSSPPAWFLWGHAGAGWVFRKTGSTFRVFWRRWPAAWKRGLGGRAAGGGERTRVEARVAAAGLAHFAKGPASVSEAMTSRLVLERAALERNLIILGSLGNNAPFIGLFGTVLGIIKAFNDLATSGQSGSAS